MVYAQISLNVGGSYVLPIDELEGLIAEIKEAVNSNSLDEVWTVKLVVMSEEEYN